MRAYPDADPSILSGSVVSDAAAGAGIAFALMAASGMTGVEDIFAGDPDFFSILSPQGDRELLTRGLGTNYEIMRGGIKRWPVGAPVQGPLHVLSELVREHRFGANEVEKVTVRIPEGELNVVNRSEMSDISLQYLLAVMLIDGTVTFKAAHDGSRMRDPRVRALAPRIELVTTRRGVLTDYPLPSRSPAGNKAHAAGRLGLPSPRSPGRANDASHKRRADRIQSCPCSTTNATIPSRACSARSSF